jgi:hypothetical protein
MSVPPSAPFRHGNGNLAVPAAIQAHRVTKITSASNLSDARGALLSLTPTKCKTCASR